jgi:hypothetical protein
MRELTDTEKDSEIRYRERLQELYLNEMGH